MLNKIYHTMQFKSNERQKEIMLNILYIYDSIQSWRKDVMTLGEIIKEYRFLGENKISLREFAESAGMSASYVCYLEKGVDGNGKPIVPSIETVNKVACVMGVTFNELYEKIFNDSSEGIIKDNRQEEELLSIFKSLPDNRKQDVINYAKMLFNNEKKGG